MPGKLYLVATPIGNLGDLSPRAQQTLIDAGFIAAEDTRVTLKLLNRMGVKKPLISYHEHNQKESGTAILSRILNGEDCALTTDAGTPVISDPGAAIVSDCISAGVEVIAIPGPCAAVTGLILSGLPAGRFCFEGFLAVNKKSRREHLKELTREKRTMVFYEAPHKLVYTLGDLLEALGDRNVSVSRELTKIHEQTLRTTLSGALEHFTQTAPKGEFVLCVEGLQETQQEAPDLNDAIEKARKLMKQGFSAKDASKKAAQETGVSKNLVYAGLHSKGEETGNK